MNYKKTLFPLLFVTVILTSCNKGFETTDNGVKYKILRHNDSARTIKPGEILLMNLKMTTETSDSLIMETYSDKSPRYIPSDEPNLKEVFAVMSKGDSAELIVNADSLFRNSFNVEKPASMKDEMNVRFLVTVVDVFSQKELENKKTEQLNMLRLKDSNALAAYISKLDNLKTTETGLMYIVNKSGSGKSPKKGSTVNMKYKGYFMNGELFDESPPTEPLSFTLGLHQVIQGWEEAAALMKEGDQLKLVIPWKLAYGERGSGAILPCTSLVFDVELLKVK